MDMIHCICNNINTAKVDRAAQCGAKSADQVQSACGKAFNCGQCRDSIEERLAVLRAHPEPLLAAE